MHTSMVLGRGAAGEEPTLLLPDRVALQRLVDVRPQHLRAQRCHAQHAALPGGGEAAVATHDVNDLAQHAIGLRSARTLRACCSGLSTQGHRQLC